MSRSVLDLGLGPTPRAKAQAIRRHKISEDQTRAQAAHQIESAQQLQSLLPPPSNAHAEPLGLQEMGSIFDQETERMWEIELRQRGLPDRTKMCDELSQLHHELFRVNQYSILDRYWRGAGQKISLEANAREIARKYFRTRIYKRCKRWFTSEDSAIYLDSHTDLSSTQLQPKETSGIPLNAVDFNSDEGLSRVQSQSETMSVAPLDTGYFSNGEGTTCARCRGPSQLGRTSGSLPAMPDPDFYVERSSARLQLGTNSMTPLGTWSVSSEEVGSCAQLQPLRNFGRLPDTINSDTPSPSTLPDWPFLAPMQRFTEQEQYYSSYMGQGNTFDDPYEQISLSYPNYARLSGLSPLSQSLPTPYLGTVERGRNVGPLCPICTSVR